MDVNRDSLTNSTAKIQISASQREDDILIITSFYGDGMIAQMYQCPLEDLIGKRFFPMNRIDDLQRLDPARIIRRSIDLALLDYVYFTSGNDSLPRLDGGPRKIQGIRLSVSGLKRQTGSVKMLYGSGKLIHIDPFLNGSR